MKKSRWRMMAVALVAFGVLASSCFQIIAFSFSKAALSPFAKGALIIDLGRVSSAANTTEYTFLLIGLGSELDLVTTSKFDLQRNFGGRYTSIRHNALRDLLLSGGECVLSGVDASDIEGQFSSWFAYRTTTKVDSTLGALGDKNRVKVKLQRISGSDSGYGSYVVFTGYWADDGDNTPESGEPLCVSTINGAIPFQP